MRGANPVRCRDASLTTESRDRRQASGWRRRSSRAPGSILRDPSPSLRSSVAEQPGRGCVRTRCDRRRPRFKSGRRHEGWAGLRHRMHVARSSLTSPDHGRVLSAQDAGSNPGGARDHGGASCHGKQVEGLQRASGGGHHHYRPAGGVVPAMRNTEQRGGHSAVAQAQQQGRPSPIQEQVQDPGEDQADDGHHEHHRRPRTLR